jgi:hypothetical protein
MKKLSALHQRVLVLGMLFAALLVPGVVSAQNAVTGAIRGVVVDPTGALVPGATVKIIDTATNATLKVVTNSEGRYSAPPAQALEIRD